MNKFIAAYDGLKYRPETTSYALILCEQEKAHLTGIFLDDATYTSYRIYDLVLEQGVSESKLHHYRNEDEVQRRQSSFLFEESCRTTSVTHNVHHDRKIAINELLQETIFSDLLIINRNENFVHHDESYPSRFMKDLLSNTQCPVLLTPDRFEEIKKIVFLFDGHYTSVYALKMFNYLLPSFKNLPIEIIAVKNMGADWHIPENNLTKEYIKRHFKHCTYTVLKGIPEVEIVKHLSMERLPFLSVLGAYRRSMLSRWFRSSMADALVENFEHPLFIAHNK